MITLIRPILETLLLPAALYVVLVCGMRVTIREAIGG